MICEILPISSVYAEKEFSRENLATHKNCQCTSNDFNPHEWIPCQPISRTANQLTWTTYEAYHKQDVSDIFNY